MISSEPPKAGDTHGALFKEIAALYGASFVLVLAAALTAAYVSVVANNLYAIVTAIFILLPYWLLTRRGLDFETFGLTMDRWGRGALWGLAFAALTAPLFFVGHYLWETHVYERTFAPSMDNYRKGPVELEGRPPSWGDGPGVWVWTSSHGLHVGMQTGPGAPQQVIAEGDTPFEWHVIGTATARPYVGEELGPHTRWILTTGPRPGRVEFRVRPGQADFNPASITLHAVAAAPDPAPPLYLGPTATPQSTGELQIKRGYIWLLLWSLTHFLFIALPEEYFYRGYLQTRLGQALARRPGPPRRVLGITAPNLITSALFALGHLLIPVGGALLAARAAVFFPSLLFGWLRERTGTIVAPVVYHGACNMMVVLAVPHFY